MKYNPWTLALIGAGLVSLPAATQADEKQSSVMTAISGTTLSGYVNTAAHWVPGSAKTTPGYAFSSNAAGTPGAKDDGFNLNVVDVAVSKPLGEGDWSAGYKAELWFGPDANSLLNNSTGANSSDFNVKQAYVELGVPVGNVIDAKLGVWDTPIGYETQNAGDNPNYTRSYGNTVEPTQHTGLYATYKCTDWLSIGGGVANTFDSKINGRMTAESRKTYLGTVILTAPDSFGALKGATLTGCVIDGRAAGAGGPDHTHIYVGATVPTPVQNLTVGAAWDHVNLTGDPQKAPPSHDTDVYGAYLNYKATEKLTLNLRGEYVHFGDAVSSVFSAGDQVTEVTATLDYALWQNVVSRVEYRWDHDLKDANHFGSGKRDNDHLIALNVIYKF
jgi:hypothetical protein